MGSIWPCKLAFFIVSVVLAEAFSVVSERPEDKGIFALFLPSYFNLQSVFLNSVRVPLGAC